MVPFPPAELGAEHVEDLVVRAVYESDRQRPGQQAVALEHARGPDGLIGQHGQGDVERADVQRQAVIHELDREHVVHEVQAHLIHEPELVGEVQHRFVDREVEQAGEHEDQVGWVVEAAKSSHGVPHGEDGAGEDEHLQQRHRPVGQVGWVAKLDHRRSGAIKSAKFAGQLVGDFGARALGHDHSWWS